MNATVRVSYSVASQRPGGIVNGGVFMTVADVATWLAIKTVLGMADRSVTAEMKTNFLSSARKEPVTCSATLVKVGRRPIYAVASCFGEKGNLLSHHTLTYVRPQ